MRPRREGDEIYGVGDSNRARSPSSSGQYGDALSAKLPNDAQRPLRMTSAADSSTHRDFTRTGLPNGIPLGPELSVGRDSPAGTLSPAYSPISTSNGQMAKSQHMPSQLRGGDGRSPSPITTDPALQSSASSSFAHPTDAFYQPRSPTIASTMNSNSGHARQGSLSGVAGADLMREMKTREVEIDSMKRRERWLKAELARAIKSGFAVQSISEVPALGLEDFGSADSDAGKLAEAIIGLKKERARLQVRLPFHLSAAPRFSSLIVFSEYILPRPSSPFRISGRRNALSKSSARSRPPSRRRLSIGPRCWRSRPIRLQS